MLTACADDTSSDNDIQIVISDKDSKQIKRYSGTILKQLYQAFPPKTKDSANKCITIIYNNNQDMENELLFDEQQQMLLRRMED